MEAGDHPAPGFDGAVGRNMTREWNVSVGSFIRCACSTVVLYVLYHDVTALRRYMLQYVKLEMYSAVAQIHVAALVRVLL